MYSHFNLYIFGFILSDPNYYFLHSGGTKEYKVLMDEFHHVSTAFLELGKKLVFYPFSFGVFM